MFLSLSLKKLVLEPLGRFQGLCQSRLGIHIDWCITESSLIKGVDSINSNCPTVNKSFVRRIVDTI